MPNTVSDISAPLPPFEQPPKKRDTKRDVAIKALMTLIAAGAIVGCSGGASFAPHTIGTGHGGSNISRALPAASPTPPPASQYACVDGGGNAGCHAKRGAGTPSTSGPIGGLTAAQLRSAYGLPAAPSSGTPSGPLVAVVDAYEASSAASDLNNYRSKMGLPPCTSANGCFTKVVMSASQDGNSQGENQQGNGSTGASWADEIALDLAMVSASCPTCKILLVEAAGQDLDSLAAAVNKAASYNPVAISNSWGVIEGGSNTAGIDAGAQAAFNHPGIAITASAGDLGQVEFPASSPYVTAVGGSTLASATNARGWTETAWTATGAGCSVLYATPAWQTGGACASARSVPDVSFLADTNPGVAVYSGSSGGWLVLGGTSVGAPFIAGLYAAAGNYGSGTTGAAPLYANASSLNAVSGGPGSPNGLGAF